MPPATPPKTSERAPPTRCVLLRPAATPIPTDLLTSLDKRGIAIIDCTDAFAAAAHVCRLEHTPPDRVILLLVAPTQQLPETTQLLDTAARYAPHAACWWYDGRTAEKLRRITPDDIAAWTARSAPPAPALAATEPTSPPAPRAGPRSGPRTGPGPAPNLRLISDADPAEPAASVPRNGKSPAPAASPGASSNHDADDAEEPASLTPTTLLTNEELAMLLADPPTPSSSAPPSSAAAGQQRTPWWRRPGSGADQ